MKNATNLVKYRRLAKLYDLFMNNSGFLNARKRAFELTDFQKDEHVLLVGVGTGQDLSLLPPQLHITGTDLSDEMLQQAHKKMINPTTKLMKMNAEKLEFNDQSFDVVVLNLILSVVEHPEKALKEALRVLKDDGRILIFDKFLKEKQKVNWKRKILNKFTSW